MIMRGLGLAIIFSTFFAAACFSQSQSRFDELMLTGHSSNHVEAGLAMNDFFADLYSKRTRYKSDEAFVRHAFREAHKRFLKIYEPYVGFPEIFKSGKYDCLTATSLMSLTLDHFDLHYEIIETNYHIFLIVNTSDGKILLETTDELNGVIADEVQIEERLIRYHENKLASAESGKYYYQNSFNLYQVVKPQQLGGLLYFNQAVTALNNMRYSECVSAIKMAVRKYNSPRITELASLAVKSIAVSNLSDEEKRDLIRTLIPYVQQAHPLAVR
jgi:hypothetical protein